MTRTSLKQLFRDEIADIRDAENQLSRALPKMVQAAVSPELRRALGDYLNQTETHIKRLDEIISRQPRRIPVKSCEVMKGLIDEGAEIIKASYEAAVKDAALIATAQRVEKYEIAAYGCARIFADLLGDSKSVRLLQVSIEDEALTDIKLTKIAKSLVHPESVEARERDSWFCRTNHFAPVAGAR